MKFTKALIFCLFSFSIVSFSQEKKDSQQWKKQAQAAQTDVEVYSEATFDSDIIILIQPGKFYWINEKTEGPFFKIRLAPNLYGYVADTELDIKGVGPFQAKSFLDDKDDEEIVSEKKRSLKKKKANSQSDYDDTFEMGSYSNLVNFNLVNYHEDTLGGIQVGDLFAIGYRRFVQDEAEPTQYSGAGLGWDLMVAMNSPKYYETKTGRASKGYVLWGGLQIGNVSFVSNRMNLRYGAGPFVKYSSFAVETSLKNYSLQDVTIGVSLEAGFQYLLSSVGLDIGIRYFWDKTPYGSLAIGFIF